MLIFIFSVSVSAQKLDHIQGELIIQLSERSTPSDLVSNKNKRQSKNDYTAIKEAPLNLYVVNFDYKTINENDLIKKLLKDPSVVAVQKNKIIAQRAVPNDLDYIMQWQYNNTGQSGGKIGADIKAQDAWDITTGGITSTGDEIVACIVDDGYDVNHEDLIDNLWINKGEIDGDGIDNDSNGYVDDVNGWNFGNNSKDISLGGGHGTPVAGIIGARGNNMLGVAGVNWAVKLMPIKYENTITEVSVLKSYSYAYAMRKKYNETNGMEGAFVVVINSSWGIDNGDPNDSPIWCDFYNELGEVGILSCGATANVNTNVDKDGDMPTSCKSDYLISVTNLDHNDIKVNSAGYGRVTIDLGAHGKDAFTVAINNRYGGFGGTSGATPHVAGAVALLYAVPCTELMTIAKSDPGLAALMVKEMILNTVDKKSGLNGITTTGGRLNIGKAVTRMNNLCLTKGDTYGFQTSFLPNGNTVISWSENKSNLITDIRYRNFDETAWIEVLNIKSNYEIKNLSYCNNYEYQVRSHLVNETSEYGFSRFFESIGCCYVSEVINLEISNGEATIELSNNESNIDNIFEFRKLGSMEWDTIISSNSITITGFKDCDLIEYRISTMCNAYNNRSETTGSLFIPFKCGECNKNSFCEVENFTNKDEWIESISINNETFTSGQGNTAFNVLTGGFVPKVKINNPIKISLVPEHSGQAYPEYFTIFIDLNQDGEFDNDTEKVFETESNSSFEVIDSMYIPLGSLIGITRMRVMMSFSKGPNVCGQTGTNYGEIEDYCIEIEESLAVEDGLINDSNLTIMPSLTSGTFNAKITDIPTTGILEVYSLNGKRQCVKHFQNSTTLQIDATTWISGTYIVRYKTIKGTIAKKMIKI